MTGVSTQVSMRQQRKIVVAQQYEIRNKLSNLIARNNSYVTLITYPSLPFLSGSSLEWHYAP